MSSVSFAKIQDNSINSIKLGILESLNLIGYRFPREVKKVAIKPNMCYYWDSSTGQTTDPKFVAALIEVVREQISSDLEISVVESDASAMKCKHAFSLLGYEKLAEQYNVNLVNLSEDNTEDTQIALEGHNFTLPVPRTIREADLRIGVPKIKYMAAVNISCAMKNIFGCNPIPLKYKFHRQLNETIVALNKIMKFNLHILDGIIVSGAFPRRLNLVMASEDPVAFDVAAFHVAGENPRKARFLRMGQKEGLGNFSYVAKGLDQKIFRKEFPRRSLSRKLVSFGYNMAIKTGLFKSA